MDVKSYRNIGIFAHVDAGKTTLTEQLLYYCGAIRSAGSVDDGTARTDSLEVERTRGISVRTSSAVLEFEGSRVNIVDTPGHSDFAGEAERAFAVLDGALLVVSAVEGVQAHTENLWRLMRERRLPFIIFVNKLDREGSRFSEVAAELRELDRRISGELGLALLTLPELCEPSGESSKSVTVKSRPDRLYEALAELDDELAERFIEAPDELPPESTLDAKLADAIRERKMSPIFCGAAALGVGIAEIMRAIVVGIPEASTDTDSPISAIVYRIEHDRDIGKVAHIRMFSGILRSRDDLATIGVTRHDSLKRENEKVETVGKISQIRASNGSRYTDTGIVTAGDIAALCGETGLKIGDIIGELSERAGLATGLAHPFLTVCARPETEAGLPALTNALRELAEEEPLMNFRWEKTEREAHIDLTGPIQLEIISTLLESRYGIRASFTPPSVIYKETPTHEGDGFEAYTMPKPCWAIVRFHLEPLRRGAGIVYDGGNIPHNQLFYKYQSHIKTSFYDSLAQGIKGWEVTDMRCTLVDGGHHTIHTHPLDFFVATPMALMDGLRRCGTTLLEPLLQVRIRAPEEILGKVIGDITNMRGEFDTPTVIGGVFTMECILPVATSLDYPVRLASLSGGRASFAPKFEGYRPCPVELGATTPRRGIDPLDRAKWILWARGAYTTGI